MTKSLVPSGETEIEFDPAEKAEVEVKSKIDSSRKRRCPAVSFTIGQCDQPLGHAGGHQNGGDGFAYRPGMWKSRYGIDEKDIPRVEYL